MKNIKAVIYAVFLASLIGMVRGNFCDEGPPGKYCFKDLAGWYNCQQQGGKMVQTETNCPQGQRWVAPFQRLYDAKNLPVSCQMGHLFRWLYRSFLSLYFIS